MSMWMTIDNRPVFLIRIHLIIQQKRCDRIGRCDTIRKHMYGVCTKTSIGVHLFVVYPFSQPIFFRKQYILVLCPIPYNLFTTKT